MRSFPHSPARGLRRLLRVALGLGLTAALARAEPDHPFFAFNTIARGGPETVVPMLKELGYDGLGGDYGDAAMASALKREGLSFFNGYATLSFKEGGTLPEDFERKIQAMAASQGVLWLAIQGVVDGSGPVPASEPRGDAVVVPALRDLADQVRRSGGRIALYPHSGFWMERVEDAGRLANALDRDDVGVTFNLCHWLKVEGSERDPVPVLRRVLPRLRFVSINGADTGDTRNMGWDRLIQPLGRGSYDVAAFVASLDRLGYKGPVGFQGYGIREDAEKVLRESIAAWRKMGSPD